MMMIFQQNILSFSSLSLVYGSYEHVPVVTLLKANDDDGVSTKIGDNLNG